MTLLSSVGERLDRCWPADWLKTRIPPFCCWKPDRITLIQHYLPDEIKFGHTSYRRIPGLGA